MKTQVGKNPLVSERASPRDIRRKPSRFWRASGRGGLKACAALAKGSGRGEVEAER